MGDIGSRFGPGHAAQALARFQRQRTLSARARAGIDGPGNTKRPRRGGRCPSVQRRSSIQPLLVPTISRCRWYSP
jgi:hypothetical protein